MPDLFETTQLVGVILIESRNQIKDVVKILCTLGTLILSFSFNSGQLWAYKWKIKCERIPKSNGSQLCVSQNSLSFEHSIQIKFAQIISANCCYMN